MDPVLGTVATTVMTIMPLNRESGPPPSARWESRAQSWRTLSMS
jgi:hypothetical protein